MTMASKEFSPIEQDEDEQLSNQLVEWQKSHAGTFPTIVGLCAGEVIVDFDVDGNKYYDC